MSSGFVRWILTVIKTWLGLNWTWKRKSVSQEEETCVLPLLVARLGASPPSPRSTPCGLPESRHYRASETPSSRSTLFTKQRWGKNCSRTSLLSTSPCGLNLASPTSSLASLQYLHYLRDLWHRSPLFAPSSLCNSLLGASVEYQCLHCAWRTGTCSHYLMIIWNLSCLTLPRNIGW